MGTDARDMGLCPECGHAKTGEAVPAYLVKRAAKRGLPAPVPQCMQVLHDYGFGDAEYCDCTFAHATTR